MQTFYWHDYETWGVSPANDKPSQFAGIRTDYDFNIIGEPLNILCQPSLDTLPHAEACLITGITPQYAEQKGVNERSFFSAIHSQLAQAGTCSVGYNSIRFDDEVTRYGLYRNFYDPYAREWQNGNSRWDIIDMLRLCYAVRPDGIEWPKRIDDSGKKVASFRLEKITELNGLSHEAAHDALSDVYATIAVAKLVKQQQPKLFEHVLTLRNKKAVQQALALGSGKPRLHISSKFGAQFASGSLILPLVQHPQNKNEIICIDLRYSPQPLFDLSAEQLAKFIFTKVDELPKGIERIPIKSVHLNRCPVVLSTGLLNESVSERLQLDINQCEQHRQQILAQTGLAQKLIAVSDYHHFDNTQADVDTMLYAGFFSNNDRKTMRRIPSLTGEALANEVFSFDDARLPELLFRYRAKNFASTLSVNEQQQWREQCMARFIHVDDNKQHNRLNKELANIDHLLCEQTAIEKQKILVDLKDYIQNKKNILACE